MTQRPGEGSVSEARSGRVHSPHCEIPIEESVVGLGCRVGQELSGIHRHRRHLDLVQLMGRNTQTWALNTLMKSPNQSRAELPK